MTDIIAMFDSDAATISWLMSVFTFVGIVIAIPTGVLLRRIGPRNVILLAVVVNVLAAVVGALVDSIGALLVTRALEGVSLVFVVASSPMVIQRCVDPGKIGLSTGIYMLGGMLGATFAGVMTPTLYYGFGYAGLWNGYALLVALCGFGFAVYIKSHHVEVRQGERASDVIRTSHRGDYGVFLKSNTLKFLIPFAIFQMALLTILRIPLLHCSREVEPSDFWLCEYAAYVISGCVLCRIWGNLGSNWTLQVLMCDRACYTGSMLFPHAQ